MIYVKLINKLHGFLICTATKNIHSQKFSDKLRKTQKTLMIIDIFSK